ncbi:hypothetical protein KIF24_19105 [Micromonospora sp. Llam7]|uniref:hypothetical protein n=1 Tax=Micromonospora tarapacensis TaxID=2835305 RepID=UPI001C8371A9|nr:hypothetical protein [Micromonospora tarapacensis]MBX7267936.1 hypothetical protein [Micromonospora tarapacensis]
MTTVGGSGSPPDRSGGDGVGQVRQEATKVGRETAQAGGQLAHEAVEQGRQVAAEIRHQARNLVREVSTQARTQAQEQQNRAAESLRTLGEQLRTMADGSDQSGMATEVARRGADAVQQAAGWLDEREPGDLVREVRDYARRHPGAFLAGAAIAGLLAGRLGRALTGGQEDHGQQQGAQQGTAEHTRPSTGTAPQGPQTPPAPQVPPAGRPAPVRHGPTGHEVGP